MRPLAVLTIQSGEEGRGREKGCCGDTNRKRCESEAESARCYESRAVSAREEHANEEGRSWVNVTDDMPHDEQDGNEGETETNCSIVRWASMSTICIAEEDYAS
jgi:hypothetical protein